MPEDVRLKQDQGQHRARHMQNPSGVDPRLYVAGVSKALSVLYAFYDRQAPLSLTEISDLTGIGRSAAQRFVYTLRALGYLCPEPGTKRYMLTPRVVDFANAYLRNDPLLEKSFSYLREASKRTGETVNLTRLDGDEIIFLSRFPSTGVISADLVIGSRLPAFCTAPGRSMLAHLDDATVQDVLTANPRRARTPHTITDLVTIRNRLHKIRAQGFEIALQECFLGDLSVAAPVFHHDGSVVAAVNIAVASPRWSEDMLLQKLAPIVVDTARAISTGSSQ